MYHLLLILSSSSTKDLDALPSSSSSISTRSEEWKLGSSRYQSVPGLHEEYLSVRTCDESIQEIELAENRVPAVWNQQVGMETICLSRRHLCISFIDCHASSTAQASQTQSPHSYPCLGNSDLLLQCKGAGLLFSIPTQTAVIVSTISDPIISLDPPSIYGCPNRAWGVSFSILEAVSNNQFSRAACDAEPGCSLCNHVHRRDRRHP